MESRRLVSDGRFKVVGITAANPTAGERGCGWHCTNWSTYKSPTTLGTTSKWRGVPP